MADITQYLPSTAADKVFIKTTDTDKFEVRGGYSNAVYQLKDGQGAATLVDDDYTNDPFNNGRMTKAGWVADDNIRFATDHLKLNNTSTADLFNIAYYNSSNNQIDMNARFNMWLHNAQMRRGGFVCRVNTVAKTGYLLGTRNGSLSIYRIDAGSLVLLASIGFGTYYITYQYRVSVIGTTFKLKGWIDGDVEPTAGGPDNDGYQLKVTDATYQSGGYLGVGAATGRHANSHILFDDLVVEGAGYSTTSPVLYSIKNMGTAGASWAGSELVIINNINSDYLDKGSVEVKFGYTDTEPTQSNIDDGTIDAALTGSWLTPDGNNKVIAPTGTGQYRIIAYKAVSDGTQQVSMLVFPELAQTVSFSGGGGSAKLVLKSTNKMGAL